MKVPSLVVLAILSSYQIYAQGVFPLQEGNIWQYQSSDPFNPMPLESKIIGDTLLSNAKRYSMLTGFTLGTNFLRQEGLKVYAYDRTDSTEYVLFDFAAGLNDTLSHHSNGQRTVVAGGKHTYPSTSSSYWIFFELAGTGPGSYVFYNWTIEDSIGLTALTMEPGNSWNLSGAIVNGRLIGTITGILGETHALPARPVLQQNYPNPFNPWTTIPYELPRPSHVTLTVYDVLGREVATLVNGVEEPGYKSVQFNASDMASGVYFCRLQSGNVVDTKKILLLR
jgi:hypothetical protein